LKAWVMAEVYQQSYSHAGAAEIVNDLGCMVAGKVVCGFEFNNNSTETQKVRSIFLC
jgi:hypothetical protein